MQFQTRYEMVMFTRVYHFVAFTLLIIGASIYAFHVLHKVVGNYFPTEEEKEELQQKKAAVKEAQQQLNNAQDQRTIEICKKRVKRKKRIYHIFRSGTYAGITGIIGLSCLVLIAFGLVNAHFWLARYELCQQKYTFYEGQIEVDYYHSDIRVFLFLDEENGETKKLPLRLSGMSRFAPNNPNPPEGTFYGRVVYTQKTRLIIWIEGDPIEEMPIVAH